VALPFVRSRRKQGRLLGRARAGLGRADRLTLVLAGATSCTAGAVLVGEFARRLQRRATQPETPGEAPAVSSPEGPVEALHLAGRATQDTVLVAIEGYESAGRQEVVLFNLLSGFAGAFAVARLSTGGIRSGWWPFRDVKVGGRHIHHFVPGILLALGSATAALLTEDLDREAALAIPFGAGAGLVFDEAALLLDLRDVYWSREGLLSVQLSLGGLVLMSGTILALRMLRRGEQRGEEAGLIPDAAGELAHG
jgi:hypothetical protein